MNEWKVIEATFDLNDRVNGNPKLIGHNAFTTKNKEDAFKKFATLYVELEAISFDWKAHSYGALKFYYEKDEKELLTNVLLHLDGEEYMEMSEEEMKMLNQYIR